MPPTDMGGDVYEVVHARVAVRSAPSLAAPAVAALQRGERLRGRAAAVRGEPWLRAALPGVDGEAWALVDASATSLGLGELLRWHADPDGAPLGADGPGTAGAAAPAEEDEEWRVAHARIAVRASPSTSARIVGAAARGDRVAGRPCSVAGARWLYVARGPDEQRAWMLIDGSAAGLPGRLLERIERPGPAAAPDAAGRYGEAFWEAPLRALPRPRWAPRRDFAAVFGGRSRSCWRNLWVLGGKVDTAYSDEVWLSPDGGASWHSVADAPHWCPRSLPGVAGGSTAPDAAPRGVLYIVGGQGPSGLLADVWASDTGGREWQRMCAQAPFGARSGMACAVVPGRPMELAVACGITATSDPPRDLWLSRDAGENFACVDLPAALPVAAALLPWPPEPRLLCAARASGPRLALWRLDLEGAGAGPCDFAPLDEFSQTFDAEHGWEVPQPPRVALDLAMQVALSWYSGFLVRQPLQVNEDDWEAGAEPTLIRDVTSPAGDAHVLCDMDSPFAALRHGRVFVLAEAQVQLPAGGAWASGRGRYLLQDRFLKLLGARLQAVRGVPLALWLGRVRPMVLPRPRSAQVGQVICSGF